MDAPNTADDNRFGDGLDDLMMEVSAVWKGGIEDVKNVVSIKSVSKNRPKDMPRKHLRDLRKEASQKSPDAYVLWMAGVKKGPVVEPVDDAPRFIFVDHNKFVKSTISLEMAKRWARESLVYVENKGSPYMLTRNMETCKYTNRSIEAWGRSKQADLLMGLNTTVYIKYQTEGLEEKKAALKLKDSVGDNVQRGNGNFTRCVSIY